MGQAASDDYTRAPVAAEHRSIFHPQPPPSVKITASTSSTTQPHKSTSSVSPCAQTSLMIDAMTEANSYVSPQNLRFCTIRDVEEAAQILLQSSDATATASNNTKRGNGTSPSFVPAGAPLDPFLVHMMQHNKFQDVLHEVQPEVLLAAVRVLQQQQTTENIAHRISKPNSTGRVNEIAVAVAPCAAVRSVGRMLFEHQLYRMHVMPHIDDAFLDALYVGSNSSTGSAQSFL
ncbi:Hypothetical protein, putative [Bodo saltans]|uniref:Uncharacterized protein n=1 Tax=Bodo saltans TaxID=75058 RepID=A0A0S4KJH7_BODSA|nr:Hypothetical protein, putative [Bodo saltans]|eukprot:CUI14696.1 Hypothetical protein, putative [Bodo saltans]